MQELQAYLARPAGGDQSRLVGAPLELTLDPAQYQPQVRFLTPQRRRRADGRRSTPRSAPTGSLAASLRRDRRERLLRGAADRRPTARSEIRRYAVNVDPDEGDWRPCSTPSNWPRGSKA